MDVVYKVRLQVAQAEVQNQSKGCSNGVIRGDKEKSEDKKIFKNLLEKLSRQLIMQINELTNFETAIRG